MEEKREIDWMEGKAMGKSCQEFFAKGIHTTMAKDSIFKNPDKCKPVLNDVPRLKFEINRLSHATSKNSAISIVEYGMKGSEKIGMNEEFNKIFRGVDISWWGVSIDELPLDEQVINMFVKNPSYLSQEEKESFLIEFLTSETTRDKTDCKKSDQKSKSLPRKKWEYFKKVIYKSTSSPFIKRSRYGSFVFSYSLDTLIDVYKQQIGDGDCDIRILGTFLYTRLEIMHVAIVTKKDDENFTKFPKIPPKNSHNILGLSSGGKNFVWQPGSISTNTPVYSIDKNKPFSEVQRRWDHLTFAFVLYGKRLILPEPIQNISFFVQKKPMLKGDKYTKPNFKFLKDFEKKNGMEKLLYRDDKLGFSEEEVEGEQEEIV